MEKRNGLPDKLNQVQRKFITKVKSSNYLDQASLDSIQFFPVYGCEPTAIGNTLLGKAAVGVPFNFAYQSISDIDTNDITLLGNQSTNWNKDVSKKLLESLILSDDAKEYALLREMYRAQSSLALLKTNSIGFLLAIKLALGELFFTFFIRQGSIKSKRQLVQGFVLLATLFLAKAVCIQKLLGQALDISLENKFISSADLRLINGGIEYCDKLLKRNMAFRKLLGKEGNKYFHTNGDLNESILSANIAISKRLQMLADHDKKLDI